MRKVVNENIQLVVVVGWLISHLSSDFCTVCINVDFRASDICETKSGVGKVNSSVVDSADWGVMVMCLLLLHAQS